LYVSSAIGKGRRARTIPLNETARNAITTILAFNVRRGFSIAADRPLLMTKKHERMTVRAVQRLVEVKREEAHLDIPATPHTLRHSYASRALSCGGNVREVQELLGHVRINTTQLYTHPSREELAAVAARMENSGVVA
jgi:integrase/recombinase XerC